MESLYHQTNRLIQEAQTDLGRLERTACEHVHLVENEIQVQIDHIISNCERLDILVNKEPISRRNNTKMRVNQLKYDCQHIQAALRQLQQRRYHKEQEVLEREALLSRRFERNTTETSVYMDSELQHNTHLQDANREMDNLLGSGTSILTSLRDQKGTLKGAHKKILDIANTLGLTNTVMRLIERRTFQDKFILVAGCITTCVIMFLVWKYFT